MKRLILLAFAAFALVGCDSALDRKVVSEKWKKYQIIGINPPKHFYITIRDVETGQVFKDLYISKHCNSWRKGRIWEINTFKETIYEDSAGKRTVRVHVGDYCNLLNKRF